MVRASRSAALAALLLAGLAALGQTGCRAGDEPLRIAIGLNAPTYRGAVLAAREINAGGGVAGRALELVGPGVTPSEPFPVTPEERLRQAERFAADPTILAVVGHSDSRSTLTASAVYNQHGLPQVVTIATHPAITNIGNWTYRLCISDAKQGPALARYAVEHWGKRRIVVIHVNDDYGRGLASSFEEGVAALGGEIVTTIPHRDTLGPDDHALLRRELGRLAEDDPPELIALFQRVEAATWTVRAIREAGLQAALLGGDNLGRVRFLVKHADLKEGLRLSQFFVANSGRPWARRFVRAYQELAGESPDYGDAFAYDAIYLLRDALAASGASRAGVKEYLDHLIAQQRQLNGVAGPYVLGPDHDARRPVFVMEVRNGAFRLLATLSPEEPPEEPPAGDDPRPAT